MAAYYVIKVNTTCSSIIGRLSDSRWSTLPTDRNTWRHTIHQAVSSFEDTRTNANIAGKKVRGRTSQLQHQILIRLSSAAAATGPAGHASESPTTRVPPVDVDQPPSWSLLPKPSHDDITASVDKQWQYAYNCWKLLDAFASQLKLIVIYTRLSGDWKLWCFFSVLGNSIIH